MRDDHKNLSGRYRQPFIPSINNPEIVEKKDWWDDLCKKEGGKNHWKKRETKAKSKAKSKGDNK